MPKARQRMNREATVYKQNASTAANSDGSFDETEKVHCVRRCRAWPNRGSEVAAMEHQQPRVEWTVQMRYDTLTALITPSMWIDLRGGERLNIVAVYDTWNNGPLREIEIRAVQTV